MTEKKWYDGLYPEKDDALERGLTLLEDLRGTDLSGSAAARRRRCTKRIKDSEKPAAQSVSVQRVFTLVVVVEVLLKQPGDAVALLLIGYFRVKFDRLADAEIVLLAVEADGYKVQALAGSAVIALSQM